MKDLSDMLAHTRKVLVEELLNVFDIAEVGGRPSLGGTRGTKGEMTIGGLVLPVPGDMRSKNIFISMLLPVSHQNQDTLQNTSTEQLPKLCIFLDYSLFISESNCRLR